MKIIRTKDYRDMSRKAANIISAQMILKDDSVLGLATGSTPIGIYAVSYTHLRAHETDSYLVCRLLLEKKKKKKYSRQF